MKRPVFIITLGFIIGIIWGLYFDIVSFIFLSLTFLIILLKIANIKHNYKGIMVLKIFIKNNTIFLILISAVISCIYINYHNNRYEKIYNDFITGEVIATVVSAQKESEYKISYNIKLERFNNKEYTNMYFILQVPKSEEIKLKYGDKIKFNGEYILPEISRNYGGFNYREYLKTKNVYGIFKTDKAIVIEEENLSKIEIYSYNIKKEIIANVKQILPKETRELFLGILIGYDDNLQENIEESFEKSNLTHLLAVSGAHIAYIVVGLTYFFKKIGLTKRIRNVLIILFLIFFMYITEFSASVVRATIMGIISLIPALIYRKQDIQTTITFSLLIILIDNPYKIMDIGLILSYLATVGIILFGKTQNKKREISNVKDKVIIYLKELLLITLFANIFVMPIMVYNFNTISLTFLISNLIAGIIIGPITIVGFILIFISFIDIKVAYIIAIPYNLLLKLLINSTNLVSKLPFSQIFVSTPNICFIIVYYLLLIGIFAYINLKKYYGYRYSFKKLQQYLVYVRSYMKNNLKFISILIIVILIFSFILKLIPRNLRIYFIDVGQGDSTLIITPANKKIMIDSGGSESGNFEVGENTLFPYLLDRGITSLDYIFISHFDSDHCQAFMYLIENMDIKNIVISKQYEITDNFNKIISIAAKRKINILKAEAGDILSLDRYTKIQILHPDAKLDGDINDNSIVMKLECFNISMLFTGDISENIEKQLASKYSKDLQTDILKVAHHGSSTSSCEEFIKQVNPKIALIGVGQNNKFGHPNEVILKRLNEINCRIYRTDLDGEIILEIDRSRKAKIDTHIN